MFINIIITVTISSFIQKWYYNVPPYGKYSAV